MGEANLPLPTRHYKRSQINQLSSACTFFYVSKNKRRLFAESNLFNKIEIFSFGDIADYVPRQISMADVGLDDLKLISFSDFEKYLAHLIEEDDSDSASLTKV
nr:hypothetical protein [uncultured Arsenicibacter sp.]